MEEERVTGREARETMAGWRMGVGVCCGGVACLRTKPELAALNMRTVPPLRFPKKPEISPPSRVGRRGESDMAAE